MLRRLRAGFDGTVAGAVLGIVIAVVLVCRTNMEVDKALQAAWICGGVGLVFGLLFGRRGGKAKE